MNGTTKFFVATTIILACVVGFFLGCMFGCPGCMNKMEACPRMQAMAGGDFPPPPPGEFKPGEFHKGHGHHGDFHKGPGHHEDFHKGPGPKGPHGDWKKGPKFDFAVLDSVMQVSPEQKAKLEANRTTMDSAFKELRKQKMEAEKNLKTAMDSGNVEQIQAAKSEILKIQESLLNQRIDGVASLNSVLTKEQQEKMHTFEKERFEKFKEMRKPKDF